MAEGSGEDIIAAFHRGLELGDVPILVWQGEQGGTDAGNADASVGGPVHQGVVETFDAGHLAAVLENVEALGIPAGAAGMVERGDEEGVIEHGRAGGAWAVSLLYRSASGSSVLMHWFSRMAN